MGWMDGWMKKEGWKDACIKFEAGWVTCNSIQRQIQGQRDGCMDIDDDR